MEKVTGMLFGKPLALQGDKETLVRAMKLIQNSFDRDNIKSEENTLVLTEEDEAGWTK